MKGGMIAILANINVVFEHVNKGTVFLIDSTNRSIYNDKKNEKCDPSGVVLLGMVTLNREHNGVLEWSKHHHDMMKKYKSNISTGSIVHHGSSGYYYAYRNKANCGMLGKFSISSYASRKFRMQSQLRGACIIEMSQMELELGINELSRHCPIFPSLISPIVTIAH